MIIEIIKLIAAAVNESNRKSDALDNVRRQREAEAYAQWQAQRLAYEQQHATAARPPSTPVPARRQRKVAPPPLTAVLPKVAEVKRAPAASATTIARWAQPKTLRSQFVLTEILKPPLSMRESRDGPR